MPRLGPLPGWSVTGWLLLVVGLASCSTAPPVQEMSDARQALQAAREAQAQVHAPDPMRRAEALMGEATEALEAGRYEQAREQALAAKRNAIEARSSATELREEQP